MDSDNFKIICVNNGVVIIEIINPAEFDGQFNIGSYIKIPHKNESDSFIVGVIRSYKIKNLNTDDPESKDGGNNFLIEVELIGSYFRSSNKEYIFERGAHGIPLPPNNGIKILSDEDYRNIFSCKIASSESFAFSKLVHDEKIKVPVNGNKFFNKHFAIVGSTGSGKSHAVAKILQQATTEKSSEYSGLNNSHIIIFDIHNEYRSAFPDAHVIDIKDLILPYWLLNSEELEELFLDTEANDHNQRNIFKEAVTAGKKLCFIGNEFEKNKIHYDSPLLFDINKVLLFAREKNEELINSGETYATGEKKGQPKTTQGSLYGKLTNFVSRLENKLNDSRLEFFLGENSKSISFEEAIRQFVGYKKDNLANTTIIDLGGIPFEVLSITVSLISRILFDFGYFYKKILDSNNAICETPILLIYEEAHKYAPKSNLARYRASKTSIERIAKEGRKYGVTLGIISQRPSEISETIFSQCSNFIAMRLTNPDDQNYVKRLLPDTLGSLTETLPSLMSGEALLIGEAVMIPSLVKIDECVPAPKSVDISYLDIWKEKWKDDVRFEEITREWKK